MNRSFAKRMEGPAAARAGADRRGLLRRARVDRRRARREDARARGRRDRAARGQGPGAARRAGPGGLRPRHVRGRRSTRSRPSSRSRSCCRSVRGGSPTGDVTLGDLIGFIALFGLLAWPMRFIGWILAELPRAVVGYATAGEVFAEPVTVLPAAHPVSAAGRPARTSRLAAVTLRLRRHAGPRRRRPADRARRIGRDRGPDRRRQVHARAAARAAGRPRRRRRC